jgi:hypothetical protein
MVCLGRVQGQCTIEEKISFGDLGWADRVWHGPMIAPIAAEVKGSRMIGCLRGAQKMGAPSFDLRGNASGTEMVQ